VLCCGAAAHQVINQHPHTWLRTNKVYTYPCPHDYSTKSSLLLSLVLPVQLV
jgi:hypothetical protein